ncbi:MAG: HEAT repeat domain-containing protein, partial [Candidatus Hydrogenedentes bacterium]|nr:HEAT repeat domain-containing protein [Candidatus Hydrogenedentota bacterium]
PDVRTPSNPPEENQTNSRVAPARHDHLLVTMSNSADPATRRSAIQGIAKSKDTDDIDIVFRALSDRDPDVRKAAQDAIESIGTETVFGLVMQALSEAVPKTPPKSVDAALPYLTRALEAKMLEILDKTEEIPVRKKVAAHCLGRMRSRTAIPSLTKLAWSPDQAMAIVASRALLDIGDDAAFDSFRGLIKHPVPEVRWAALQGISRTGGPETTTMLSGAALGSTETNLELRKRATILLGKSNDPAAIPYLIEVLRSQSPLRSEALTALRTLTGLDAGGDAYSWIEWYRGTQKPPATRPAPANASAATDEPPRKQ